MKRLVWIVAAGALMWSGGAGWAQSDPGGAEPPREGQPAEQPAAEPAEQPGQQSRAEVELLEAGAEPRQALRYQPVIGQAEQATIETKMSSAVTMNGQEMPPQTLPVITMVMRMTPQGEGAEGIEYRFAFEDASVEQGHQASDMMGQAIAPLVGVAGSGAISPRGESLRFQTEGLDNLPPMMREQIESMSSQTSQLGLALPEEPVGVGARWRVTMSLTNGGMEMKQISTATLKSIDDGALRIALEVEQTAPEQEFAPPQMGGMKVKLLSLDGDGTGEMTVDLRRLVPVRSSVAMDTKMRMSMDMGGEQTIAQTMSMTMSVAGALVEDAAEAEPEAEEGGAGDDGGGN